MKQEKKIFLGIDPGLADTGFGIITEKNNAFQIIDYGSIKTKKDLSLPERLKIIETELNKIIKKHKPTLAGIEQLFFCKNVTTAMAVGQARGVSVLTVAKNNIPIVEFTPLQVKQAVTGYGKADKQQVQEMVKTILKLETIPQPDDAADALAIAICVSSHQKMLS